MVKNELRNPSCFIGINSDGKVLLGKRSLKQKIEPGKWGFFGGKAEDGETFEEAVFREVLEEAGIEIDEYDYFRSYFYNGGRAVYFYGRVSDVEIELNSENTEFGWFTFDEAKKLDLAFNQNEVLEDFSKFY